MVSGAPLEIGGSRFADLECALLHAQQLADCVGSSRTQLFRARLVLGMFLLDLRPSVPHGLWEMTIAGSGIHKHTARRSIKVAERARREFEHCDDVVDAAIKKWKTLSVAERVAGARVEPRLFDPAPVDQPGDDRGDQKLPIGHIWPTTDDAYRPTRDYTPHDLDPPLSLVGQGQTTQQQHSPPPAVAAGVGASVDPGAPAAAVFSVGEQLTLGTVYEEVADRMGGLRDWIISRFGRGAYDASFGGLVDDMERLAQDAAEATYALEAV